MGRRWPVFLKILALVTLIVGLGTAIAHEETAVDELIASLLKRLTWAPEPATQQRLRFDPTGEYLGQLAVDGEAGSQSRFRLVERLAGGWRLEGSDAPEDLPPMLINCYLVEAAEMLCQSRTNVGTGFPVIAVFTMKGAITRASWQGTWELEFMGVVSTVGDVLTGTFELERER
jgi:hypothetical protein